MTTLAPLNLLPSSFVLFRRSVIVIARARVSPTALVSLVAINRSLIGCLMDIFIFVHPLCPQSSSICHNKSSRKKLQLLESFLLESLTSTSLSLSKIIKIDIVGGFSVCGFSSAQRSVSFCPGPCGVPGPAKKCHKGCKYLFEMIFKCFWP